MNKCIVCGDENPEGGTRIFDVWFCTQHELVGNRMVNHVIGELIEPKLKQVFASFPQWNPEWKYGTDEYFAEDEKATTELYHSLRKTAKTEME